MRTIIIYLIPLIVFSADFNICADTSNQLYPRAIYKNNQYYVFWSDQRHAVNEGLFAVYGSRVSANGTVIDSTGKLLFKRIPKFEPTVASDGINFLVTFRDSC